jgi:cell wall-associated NlpC family hydrolase
MSEAPISTDQAAPEVSRNARLVSFLRDQVDKPYLYGVDSRAVGGKAFDCSSLVQEAYRIIGLEIARTSVNQATYFGRLVEENEEYQIGDLLFFTGEYGYYNPQYPMGIGHVATYIGDNRVIHTRAWYDEDGVEHGEVIEESVEDAIQRRAVIAGHPDFVVVKRIVEGNTYHHEGEVEQSPSSV